MRTKLYAFIHCLPENSLITSAGVGQLIAEEQRNVHRFLINFVLGFGSLEEQIPIKCDSEVEKVDLTVIFSSFYKIIFVSIFTCTYKYTQMRFAITVCCTGLFEVL